VLGARLCGVKGRYPGGATSEGIGKSHGVSGSSGRVGGGQGACPGLYRCVIGIQSRRQKRAQTTEKSRGARSSSNRGELSLENGTERQDAGSKQYVKSGGSKHLSDAERNNYETKERVHCGMK